MPGGQNGALRESTGLELPVGGAVRARSAAGGPEFGPLYRGSRAGEPAIGSSLRPAVGHGLQRSHLPRRADLGPKDLGPALLQPGVSRLGESRAHGREGQTVLA